MKYQESADFSRGYVEPVALSSVAVAAVAAAAAACVTA